MIDPRTPMPPSNPKDEFSDELFDPDFLGDADSDLFGELDRVLTTGDGEAEREDRSADIADALEPLELEIETQNAGQGAPTAPVPVPDDSDRHSLEAPPAPKVSNPPQELRQHGRRSPAPGETETATPVPGSGVAATSVDTGGGAKTRSASATVSKPRGSADLKPAPGGDTGRDSVKTRRRAPGAHTATPRSTGRLRSRVSPVWLGIVALLAVSGIGIGAGAIWLQSETEAHLAWMETKLAAAVGPSGAERDARDAETAGRVRVMEERLEAGIVRLHAAQDELRSSLARRLESQNERLDQDLGGLQSALVEVRGHLAAVQNQLAANSKRPKTAGRRSATGPGAVAKKGDWVVNLISFQTQAKADKWRARLRDDGIPATVQTVVRKGRTWYRLLVGGFADFAQAQAYAQEIRSKPDLSSPWIGRN